MKSAHSLILLSVLASLSLTSCGQDWSWNGTGYNRVPLGGRFYASNFNGAPSFGGHGGGYGNGYSVWPQPTLNYGENFVGEDDPLNVGNSWEHGDPAVPARMNVATRTVSQETYDSGRTSGK